MRNICHDILCFHCIQDQMCCSASSHESHGISCTGFHRRTNARYNARESTWMHLGIKAMHSLASIIPLHDGAHNLIPHAIVESSSTQYWSITISCETEPLLVTINMPLSSKRAGNAPTIAIIQQRYAVMGSLLSRKWLRRVKRRDQYGIILVSGKIRHIFVTEILVEMACVRTYDASVCRALPWFRPNRQASFRCIRHRRPTCLARST